MKPVLVIAASLVSLACGAPGPAPPESPQAIRFKRFDQQAVVDPSLSRHRHVSKDSAHEAPRGASLVSLARHEKRSLPSSEVARKAQYGSASSLGKRTPGASEDANSEEILVSFALPSAQAVLSRGRCTDTVLSSHRRIMTRMVAIRILEAAVRLSTEPHPRP